MAFVDEEDDPFGDEFGDYNPPFDPFGDDDIVLVQSPGRTTRIDVAILPLGTSAIDRLEQHVLHAIFVGWRCCRGRLGRLSGVAL